MANLNIKLVKSLNGRIAKHKATAEALGLRKIGDTTVQPDNEATRGKIAHIGYLLQVTEENYKEARDMNLHELSPAAGSNTKAYRKGRGNGSGNGKTGGRGQKGQWARSGGGVRVGFEGGQMPLTRRIPKRGFHNTFAKPLEAVNVSVLEKFEDGAVVDAKALLEKGILSKCEYGVKILGNGSLTKKLTVQASAFSASAKEKIEAAGGKAEVI